MGLPQLRLKTRNQFKIQQNTQNLRLNNNSQTSSKLFKAYIKTISIFLEALGLKLHLLLKKFLGGFATLAYRLETCYKINKTKAT